jgi:hypothetical protein
MNDVFNCDERCRGSMISESWCLLCDSEGKTQFNMAMDGLHISAHSITTFKKGQHNL